jgi:mannosyltransferase OCH1-like enzyme
LWVGPKKPPLELMQTWKDNHPDWEYMFWNEDSIKEHFPDGLHNQWQYDNMPEWNGKCDIARWEIVHKFGGFFMDADSLSARPIDEEMLENDSFSCYENEHLRQNLIAAGYFAATKENELCKILIDKLHKKTGFQLWEGGVTAWKTVGPVFLTETVFQHQYNNITIYPSHYFIPKHYNGLEYTGPFKPYAHQLWGSTPNNPEFSYED